MKKYQKIMDQMDDIDHSFATKIKKYEEKKKESKEKEKEEESKEKKKKDKDEESKDKKKEDKDEESEDKKKKDKEESEDKKKEESKGDFKKENYLIKDNIKFKKSYKENNISDNEKMQSNFFYQMQNNEYYNNLINSNEGVN